MQRTSVHVVKRDVWCETMDNGVLIPTDRFGNAVIVPEDAEKVRFIVTHNPTLLRVGNDDLVLMDGEGRMSIQLRVTPDTRRRIIETASGRAHLEPIGK
jgi:hypothetical protein